jgi:hypothetical protein
VCYFLSFLSILFYFIFPSLSLYSTGKKEIEGGCSLLVVGWVFYFLFLEKRNIPSE